jgi:hypothetical protein
VASSGAFAIFASPARSEPQLPALDWGPARTSRRCVPRPVPGPRTPCPSSCAPSSSRQLLSRPLGRRRPDPRPPQMRPRRRLPLRPPPKPLRRHPVEPPTRPSCRLRCGVTPAVPSAATSSATPTRSASCSASPTESPSLAPLASGPFQPFLGAPDPTPLLRYCRVTPAPRTATLHAISTSVHRRDIRQTNSDPPEAVPGVSRVAVLRVPGREQRSCCPRHERRGGSIWLVPSPARQV